MKDRIEQLDEEALLYQRVQKLENDTHLLNTLVKTLYDQQVAQERAFQTLRKQLDSQHTMAWSRGH